MPLKILMLCLLFSLSASARCPLDLTALSQRLYPDQSLSPLSSCTRWPEFPETTLVALLHPITGESSLRLSLLLLDSHSLQPRAHYQSPQPLPLTADSQMSVEFDTTSYPLAANTRGFGLRLSQKQNEAPFEEQVRLSLYVEDVGQLRPVLSDLLLHYQRTEPAAAEATACSSRSTYREKRLLRVKSTQSQGWFDIQIRASHEQRQQRQQGMRCKDYLLTSRQTSSLWRYQAGQYQPSSEMAP